MASGQVARLGLQALTDDVGALLAMVFALLLGRGDGSGRHPAARIVPILHAFFEESIISGLPVPRFNQIGIT